MALLVAPETPNTSGPKLKLPGVTFSVLPAAKAAPNGRRLRTKAAAARTLRRKKPGLDSTVDDIWLAKRRQGPLAHDSLSI